MQDRDLSPHRGELMEMMGKDGCSSDDTDRDESGREVFRRRPPVWRSVYLRDLLQNLDRKIMEHGSTNGRRRKGPNPRRRLDSDHANASERPAPIGLPLNCYDEGRLAKLEKRELERLEVVQSDHNFTAGFE